MTRNKSLNVRFNEKEYNELQYLSDLNGISMSDLVRQTLKNNLNKPQSTNIGCTINNFNAPTQINNNCKNDYNRPLFKELPTSNDMYLEDGSYFLDVNYDE